MPELSGPVRSMRLSPCIHRSAESSGDESTDVLSQSPIDVDLLYRRCFRKDSLVRELLNVFAISGLERIEHCAWCLENKDFSLAAESAHTLKGTAAIVCADLMRDLAHELEIYCRAKSLEAAESLIRQLRQVMRSCINQIPRILKREELHSGDCYPHAMHTLHDHRQEQRRNRTETENDGLDTESSGCR